MPEPTDRMTASLNGLGVLESLWLTMGELHCEAKFVGALQFSALFAVHGVVRAVFASKIAIRRVTINERLRVSVRS